MGGLNITAAHPGTATLSRGTDPDAPLMVLVHGLEATPASWKRFAARWSHSWRVIALDLPWRAGGSHHWRRSGTAAQWLDRALGNLGETPDALVGHSFGANAVLELLATSARPITHAPVLISPFYCPTDQPVGWDLFERARSNFEATINDGLSTWLARRDRPVDQDVLASISSKVRDRVGPVAFTTWFEHFVASGRLPLDSIGQPTLALSGRDDSCLGEVRGAALAAAMPALRLEIEDDYDHFCHIRQAARVAARVAAFLPVSAHGAGFEPIEEGAA